MKSLTSRTTLITAVAVAGVLIAGTAAIAANIGILNASNDSSIGSLSATDDLVPSTTLEAGVPVVLETATPTTADRRTTVAESSYLVDDAGTVSVTRHSRRACTRRRRRQPGMDAGRNAARSPVAPGGLRQRHPHRRLHGDTER